MKIQNLPSLQSLLTPFQLIPSPNSQALGFDFRYYGFVFYGASYKWNHIGVYSLFKNWDLIHIP